MLIDWPTVGFQIINFLLLIYLLKRFLYGPIIRAMQSREAELAAIRSEAEQARTEAQQTLADLRDRERRFDEWLAERRRQAEAEADQRRRELLAQAREDAETQRRNWRQALHAERRTFLNGLKQRSAAGVLRLTRQALMELTNEELETALVGVMIRRLEALPAEEMQRFIDAAQQSPLHIRSGFEPSGELRRQLAEAMQRNYDLSPSFDWHYDPERPLELEISTDGLRLSWGMETYLTELQQSVAEVFKQSAATLAQEPPQAAEEAP